MRDKLKLTPREHEVLALRATGVTRPDIAERLCLTPKTVDYYYRIVGEKTGLGIIEAVARYQREQGHREVLALVRETLSVDAYEELKKLVQTRFGEPL